MNQRIDLMPESCRARLGRKRQIRFWIAMYSVTTLVVIGGNTLFELSKSQVRRDSAIISEKVALDAEQQVKANQLTNEIHHVEQALDRNARIAWPIDISDVIAAIGSQTPKSVYLTKIALTPRQERVTTVRKSKGKGKGKDDDGPDPLPRTTLQVECAGVAPDDNAMAVMVANLESHPLFGRIAVEHVKPKTIAGREVKEFGITCEVDFFHRFEFEPAVASADDDTKPGPSAPEDDR